MPAFFTFTTPPFSVASASAIDSNTVRVILTTVPNAFVPANFSIPTTTVISAVSDPYDANSVILSLSPGLQPNNYTVTCSGLTAGSPPVVMTAPFTAAFTVFVGPPITVAPNQATPAVNPSALTTLQSHIPPSMRGTVWDELLATLSQEEQFSWDQAAAVYDQLFLVSAEGQYLDQRASEEGGYERPELVGFTDDVFRDLVIQLSTRKLTINAFLRILEIYYGIDAVRAFVRTTTAEPFIIPDSSVQSFNIDGIGPFDITFKGVDFTNTSSVSAIEAAIALNRGFALIGAKALALPFVDAQTGLIYLTVYTASRGLRGSMESVSGPLPFPTGRKTVQTQARAAYVKVTGDEVEVILPATSIVVSREPVVDAAYLNGSPPLTIIDAVYSNFLGLATGPPWGSDAFWGSDVSWGGVVGQALIITTSAPHGMSIGNEFFLDGLQVPNFAGFSSAVNGIFVVVDVPAPNVAVCRIKGTVNIGFDEVVDTSDNFVVDTLGNFVLA